MVDDGGGELDPIDVDTENGTLPSAPVAATEPFRKKALYLWEKRNKERMDKATEQKKQRRDVEEIQKSIQPSCSCAPWTAHATHIIFGPKRM